MRRALPSLLLACACGGSSGSAEHATPPQPTSAPQAATTAEPTAQPSSQPEQKAPDAPKTALEVGARVLVGAGFIFEEGTIESHECKGGSVEPGHPCIAVRGKLSGVQDISVPLIHPIDGHIVKSPAADRFFVCGMAISKGTAWSPCRTLGGNDGTRCELLHLPQEKSSASKKPLCSELVVVKVADRTTKVLEEAFAKHAEPRRPGCAEGPLERIE